MLILKFKALKLILMLMLNFIQIYYQIYLHSFLQDLFFIFEETYNLLLIPSCQSIFDEH